MTGKKILKIILAAVITVLLIGGSVAYYLFNMTHRDVQTSKTDYTLKAAQIVDEYLADAAKANEKYLDSEGESKIIEVSGIVNTISEDFNNNKVILLKSESDKAGVSCTFSVETNKHVSNIKVGSEITLKGVIRAGASFDSDLDLYEDVIMEKCDIVFKK